VQLLLEIVQDLIKKGVIRKSYSQYASPTFLVPKPFGEHRVVVDYRLLKRKVVFDAFPMPNVESTFQNFAKATILLSWTTFWRPSLKAFNHLATVL
jgi:hypothetical protein